MRTITAAAVFLTLTASASAQSAAASGIAAGGGAQSPAPPGASACSGCHGPGRAGASVPPLQGQSPEDMVEAMRAFRTGQRPATVMDRIAKGFSDEETRAIANWLGQSR